MIINPALSPSEDFIVRCPYNRGCEISLFYHQLANDFVLVFMRPSVSCPSPITTLSSIKKKKAAPLILRHFTLFKRSQYTGYKGHDIYNSTVNRLVSGGISSLSVSINPPSPLTIDPTGRQTATVGWDGTAGYKVSLDGAKNQVDAKMSTKGSCRGWGWCLTSFL